MIGSGTTRLICWVLSGFLVVLIVDFARPALARATPAAAGVHAFSALAGRAMMLVAAVGLALFDLPLRRAAGPSAFAVAAVACVALGLQSVLEMVRPRRRGEAIGPEDRPTLRSTLGFGYLAAAGAALVVLAGALTFSMVINPKPVATEHFESYFCSTPCSFNSSQGSGPFGFINSPSASDPGAPSTASLLTTAALLMIAAVLAWLVIGRALRRTRLIGLEITDDDRDRRISARRAARAFMAACIGGAAAVAGDVADALRSSAPAATDTTAGADSTGQLHTALAQYLDYVQIACVVVIVGLYLAGLPSRWESVRATQALNATG